LSKEGCQGSDNIFEETFFSRFGEFSLVMEGHIFGMLNWQKFFNTMS